MLLRYNIDNLNKSKQKNRKNQYISHYFAICFDIYGISGINQILKVEDV